MNTHMTGFRWFSKSLLPLTLCGCGTLPAVSSRSDTLLILWRFNPFTLRAPPQSSVCYFHTFENNLGIKRKFKKKLKESCCLSAGQHFSIKYFPKNAFRSKGFTKLVRPVLAALSVNGLINVYFRRPWSPHLLNCTPLFGHPNPMLLSYNTLTW